MSGEPCPTGTWVVGEIKVFGAISDDAALDCLVDGLGLALFVAEMTINNAAEWPDVVDG